MAGILDAERVRQFEFTRPSRSIIERYQALSTSDLAGLVARALDKLGVSGTVPANHLTPFHPGRTVVGPAVTVRNIPEREVALQRWNQGKRTQLGEREAFFIAEPGDVVVIDGESVFPASSMGPMSVSVAAANGVAGVVVAGAITGVPGVREASIPVWARGGTTITGHQRVDTIEINGPIGIHGVRVEPGDIIVADDSGVTIVPFALASTTLETAEKLRDLGSSMRSLLARGASRDELRTATSTFMSQLTQGEGKDN